MLATIHQAAAELLGQPPGHTGDPAT